MIKSWRYGRSISGRSAATSRMSSPCRTHTRGAEPSIEKTPYGRWSSPNPSFMRRLDQSQPQQVLERLADAARAVRREPPARAGQVALPGHRDQVVGVVVVEHLRDLGARAAVEGDSRGEQDVEEAEVLESGVVVAMAYGVVQPGGALERRLAVEGGVDPGRDGRGGGGGGGLGPRGCGASAGAGPRPPRPPPPASRGLGRSGGARRTPGCRRDGPRRARRRRPR